MSPMIREPGWAHHGKIASSSLNSCSAIDVPLLGLSGPSAVGGD